MAFPETFASKTTQDVFCVTDRCSYYYYYCYDYHPVFHSQDSHGPGKHPAEPSWDPGSSETPAAPAQPRTAAPWVPHAADTHLRGLQRSLPAPQ